MKRILALLLTFVLILGVMPAPQAQAANATATVKGGWLRLRDDASFDAETIASYYTGTRVTVLGTSGAWYHVTAPDGLTGYMYGSYLTVGSSGSSENIAAYVTSRNGKGVRLRSGPSTAYGVIGLYSVGTQLTILSSGTYWHYVKIGNQRGYMMAEFVTQKTPGSAADYTAYVTSKNGRGVNLRKGPSTGYGAIGSYAVGTEVTVHSVSGEWSYITIGGQKGYMMSKYLTTAKPPISGGTYTAYVTSQNGKGVYLRSGAGKGYAALGLYSVGTQVTVLEHGKTWDYIQIGSRKGYMMNDFLVTEQPGGKTVTGVTLNTASPVAGDTLWANVTPAGANVTYEWMDDRGLLLSTKSNYTLTDSDVGRKIRVRVTGSNGYTGSAVSSFAKVSAAPTEDKPKPISGTVAIPAAILPGVELQPSVAVNCPSLQYQWCVNGVVVSTAPRLTVTDDMAGKTVVLKVVPESDSGYTGAVESNVCTVVGRPSTTTDL